MMVNQVSDKDANGASTATADAAEDTNAGGVKAQEVIDDISMGVDSWGHDVNAQVKIKEELIGSKFIGEATTREAIWEAGGHSTVERAESEYSDVEGGVDYEEHHANPEAATFATAVTSGNADDISRGTEYRRRDGAKALLATKAYSVSNVESNLRIAADFWGKELKTGAAGLEAVGDGNADGISVHAGEGYRFKAEAPALMHEYSDNNVKPIPNTADDFWGGGAVGVGDNNGASRANERPWEESIDTEPGVMVAETDSINGDRATDRQPEDNNATPPVAIWLRASSSNVSTWQGIDYDSVKGRSKAAIEAASVTAVEG
ncbi:hypothetical protein HK101_008135, partial [Irineochytrium annulatum]